MIRSALARRAAELGLSVREVGNTLLANVGGLEAGRYREGGEVTEKDDRPCVLIAAREGTASDPDRDGIPNSQDEDSDGDCIPDAIEAGDPRTRGLVGLGLDAPPRP
mgnify:CR=1 FL=1